MRRQVVTDFRGRLVVADMDDDDGFWCVNDLAVIATDEQGREVELDPEEAGFDASDLPSITDRLVSEARNVAPTWNEGR